MRENTTIGLLGDIHSEDVRLAQALEFFGDHDISTILSTGDIVDGPGCPNRCIELLQQFNVKSVLGNHERWLLSNRVRHIPMAHTLDDLSLESKTYLQALPKSRCVQVGNTTILLCHGIADQDMAKVWPGTEHMPAERNLDLDRIIAEKQCQWLINGHLHFRTLLCFKTLTLVNAGTLTGSRWPGFMTLDLSNKIVRVYEFAETSYQFIRQARVDPQPIWQDTQSFDANWDPYKLVNPVK
ncbi:MAG: metallophosphoesterase family protein [Pseudomonadales bacterium]|jgi:predicted phosphodiesterase|nr:metallophosphoesterase family protein [Pseudomonadales bacterium]MDA0761332.1 metallophosphoesterase family protein [Pseudomonadota bacterium]MDA0957360.1 metallophosphoesterase family protein [Pseudomonadota bacterium]